MKATFLPLSRVVKEIMTFHVPKKSCITKKNNDVGEVEELYIIHHCNDEKKSAS